MEKSSTKTLEKVIAATQAPDRLSVRRWLVLYATYLLALAVPTAIMLGDLAEPWRALFLRPYEFAAPQQQVLKLFIFGIYISLACTFLPLPTGWLVAGLATRHVALSQHALVTMALVASVGAAASTVANLHDYHMFTWILRHKRLANVRATRLHRRAARWFGRRPFALLVIFNVLPIPIDVVRMLSATCRYPLRRFAAANFIGRWIRYAVLAFVAFELGGRGWIAVLFLLATAILLWAYQGLRRTARPAVARTESDRLK